MVVLEEGTKGSFPSTCLQEALEASSALIMYNLNFLSAAKESLKFKRAQTAEGEKLLFLVVRNLVPFEYISAT